MIIVIILMSIVMGLCCAYLITQFVYIMSNSFGDSSGSFEHFTGGSSAMHYIDARTLTYKEFKEK